MSDVQRRLAEVRARIGSACAACGRDARSVRLVAVSKFHSVDAMREAYAAGQRDFGENYAQELEHKARALKDLTDLRLHFIGGFQSNKARQLARSCHVVETLASKSAATALHERACGLDRRIDVMLQVNTSGESQKSGVLPEEVGELSDHVRGLSSLSLEGLMTIPRADDLALAKHSYRLLSELARTYGVRELSMGMSDDLEIAIEAGATNVRVGTAIFGPRPTRE